MAERYNGSGTEIDSEGTAAVTVNNTSTTGTGGFIVYQGGANYNTQAFRRGQRSAEGAPHSGAIAMQREAGQEAAEAAAPGADRGARSSR